MTLLKLKHNFPDAKIVVGNTEVGIEVKFKQMVYPILIQPVQIPEMTTIEEVEEGVKIGASATLADIELFLGQQMKIHAEHKTRIFRALLKMLHWFAGKQIRSVGALGSNIMTGSPISDMIPLLMAARAQLELQNQGNGIRRVVLDDEFFIGYRRNIVKPNEILVSILIPFSAKNQYFQAYKQSRRREDDIAIVNAAINVSFEPKSSIIVDINFGFGGMSFKTVSAPKTQEKLRGLPWNRNTLDLAFTHLLEDLPLEQSAPGGMIQYRRSLALSLFFRAFLAISEKIQKYTPGVCLDTEEISGIDGYTTRELKSSQYFSIPTTSEKNVDSLHKPIVHLSAYKQATGEAVYCDDIPHQEGELYCAFVLSTKAHARIINIDESEALGMKGVRGFVSSKDIEEGYIWGSIVRDEEVFYSKTVTSQGQILGMIVADDQTLAQRQPKRKGCVEDILKQAAHVIEGDCRLGGQEHFYLETQACIVIPKAEDDEMEIYSSTQNPSEVSALVSDVLGVPQNKIIVRVKKLGGGFGGKQSKACLIALPMAVAARKFNRPLRCMLDRDEDMLMVGTRHPFYCKYKVAFNDEGKILGCDAELYSNAGYSNDLSYAVMEKALTHFENAYHIPVITVKGFLCKTNLPSNTAFRGFGGPQGMYLGECIAQHVADYLKMDPFIISEKNLYKEGDVTHYNQKLTDSTLERCWKECIETSQYYHKKESVKKFNRENRYKKRGISVIPTKYGISYSEIFLNQAGALVLIYRDGSVLITHGGTEMGQGLHTKMIQVASRALEIPVAKIHISETATDKVPNTSATAASSGSDLNGMAIINACSILKNRLKPYKEANPEGTWEQWVDSAYFDRVSLAVSGFYKTPEVGYNFDTGEGLLYNYFTYGAACTEVEIDTLTGDHQVLRTDIVMDLGESLNPAIDIGQIEGGFLQGYGLFVLEEMVYSPKGDTYTKGPGTYKIPGFSDIPAEFNVSLLKGVSNPRAVYSSKAIGEPPLFLASSAFFAIKNAIKAARQDHNLSAAHFRFDAPATSARIRMACEDGITSRIKEPEPGSFKPWNVVA
ncbi:hypothetical protein JTB14_007388 [Gonioctena quinquepunctata]|nr:hypothetical protein JTB14_007388 [Gonioctena quinquepunctata]